MNKRFLKSKIKHLLKDKSTLLDVLNDSGYKPSIRNCEYKSNEFIDKVKLFILKNKVKKTRKQKRKRNNKSKRNKIFNNIFCINNICFNSRNNKFKTFSRY